MSDAVIVIDMTRAFFDQDRPLYVGDRARNIIPRVRQLLEKELLRGSRILFLNDCHAPGDPEFKMFAPHAIKGTEETEVIPELADIPGEVVPKTRYSVFWDTPERKAGCPESGQTLSSAVSVRISASCIPWRMLAAMTTKWRSRGLCCFI